MTKISYAGYRFPPEIIQQAIWLYLRFTLSFRDVEDLLAERGIVVSYETVRRWVNHFGPMIAADLRKRRPKPHSALASGRGLSENRWPDGLSLARSRRRRRGPRCPRPIEAKQACCAEIDAQTSEEICLRAGAIGHGRLAVLRLRGARLGLESRRERGRWKNNRAENSHQPTRRRERKMQRFKSPGSAQKFLSTHAAVYNTFNVQRHLTSAQTHRVLRAAAMDTWRTALAAA